MSKKLYRSRTNKVFTGLCGGLGEYLHVKPIILRVIAVVIAWFITIWIVPIYIVAAIIIHKEPLQTPAYFDDGLREVAPEEPEAPSAANDAADPVDVEVVTDIIVEDKNEN